MFRKEIKVVLAGSENQQDNFMVFLNLTYNKGKTSQGKSDNAVILKDGYQIIFQQTSESKQSAAHTAIKAANGIIILGEELLRTFGRNIFHREASDGIPVIRDQTDPNVCIDEILRHIENMKHEFKGASKEEKSEGVIENVKSFFKLFDNTLAQKINEFKEKNIQGIDRDKHSLN